MQTEARVGVVVEGEGQRALHTGHGGVAVAQSLPQPQRKSLQQQHQSQIGTVSQLLAGGVAGALAKTCTAPLARLTILFQIQGMHSDVATMRKASIWREASRIIGEEGFRAFWKGNLVTIAHRLPYSSVNFYAYEQYKKILQTVPGLKNSRDNMSTDICVHFVGGGLAGITAATATYPLDLVRTRLAAQTNVLYYRGIWHALRTITRDEGIFGLYKGLGATLLGVGPSIAISFTVYETLRSYWQSQRPDDSTVLVSLACGSLSGIASSTEDVVVLDGSQSFENRKQALHQVSNQTDPRANDKNGVVFNLAFGSCSKEADKKLFLLRHSSNLIFFNNKDLILTNFIQHFFGDLSPKDMQSILLYGGTTATFPLDLVRRRKQLEGAGGRARVYTTGLFGTFKHIFRTEGLCGLYRGILPEYYKVVPGVGICFMTYETLKMLLADVSATI